jgi:hypothetical protein
LLGALLFWIAVPSRREMKSAVLAVVLAIAVLIAYAAIPTKGRQADETYERVKAKFPTAARPSLPSLPSRKDRDQDPDSQVTFVCSAARDFSLEGIVRVAGAVHILPGQGPTRA